MYPLNSEGDIILNEVSFITVKDFEDKFSDRETHQFNYEYLYNHENCTPAWKEIFSGWKQKGILN